MNIFLQDAFSTLQMTSAIERVPYIPDGLGALGIFTPTPIRTRALAVEERNGVLGIIPTSERGSPVSTERDTERRVMRYFEVPRITQGDTITADEIAGIRAFGQETELMQVAAEVARRLSGPTGLLSNVRFTHEHMRLAAVQGRLIDADGTVLYDWFDEFGITPAAPFYFNLLAEASGTLRPLCNKIVRSIARSAKGLFNTSTRVVALCGDDFYDKFTNHPDVIKTFLNWSAAQDLRDGSQGAAFSTFNFAGIDWVNYRGSDDGSSIKIADDEVRFFPKTPGVFEQAMAPAETFEFVNTPGQNFYVIPIIDRDRNMFWRQEVYSYPLFICKRPDVLRKGSMDAAPGGGG